MSESSGIPGLPEGATRVGKVSNFYSRRGVIAVQIDPGAELAVGDEIRFVRKDTDNWDSLKIISLQKNREPISKATGGEHVGVLTGVPVGKNEIIYRIPQPRSTEGTFVKQ